MMASRTEARAAFAVPEIWPPPASGRGPGGSHGFVRQCRNGPFGASHGLLWWPIGDIY